VISRKQIAGMAQARPPTPVMIPFRGGLDQETPPLQLQSGFCRAAQNYEANVNGGYDRIKGYECFDGRPAPSDALYTYLVCSSITGGAVGDTLTGAGGATGKIIVVTSTYFVVTKRNATAYVIGENLNVGAGTIAVASTVGVVSGAPSTLLHAQWLNLAADVYRADIAVPTGSGSSLGGIRFGGVLYTFRNNAGGTAVDVWKSTASGWSQVTLFNEIAFTVGAVAIPAEGATLTQGGVTATLKRIVLTSGTFAGGTAAGRFIITTPSGGTGNFTAGAATLTGGVTCNLTAVQTAITLLPGGRYEFVVENFGGSTATKRIYGCDGVNRGFEFDGTVLVPITTGMTLDAPNHVYAHKSHLFFSFLASVQHSGVGTPYVWSVVLGAAELAMGDTVNGFQTQPGNNVTGALAIFTRNRTSILYGTGVSSWQLVAYRAELGAYPYTVQDAGKTIFLDDQGVTTFETVQAFGNFAHNAISARLKSWVNSQRTKVVESCVSRDKSQYRLFFSDGYALYVTFAQTSKGKVYYLMPMLFPNPVTWAYSSEEADGTETIFFGSTNGMVYQMEKGTSFDGGEIEHFLYLAWDFLKSPRTIKRFYDCTLEITGSGYFAFSFSYELGYASADVGQPASQSAITSFSGGVWDVGVWDVGVWDGQTLMPSHFDAPGEAENISIIIRGSSDYHESVKMSGAIIHSTPRRQMR
jgi:hypothetical protein